MGLNFTPLNYITTLITWRTWRT